jgi:hypothetical protein
MTAPPLDRLAAARSVAAAPAVPSPTRPAVDRLRFVRCTVAHGRLGRAQVEVVLQGGGADTPIVGRAEGDVSPVGDFRLVAEATLQAIAQVTGDTIAFDLLGAKTVRAFDALLAIVAIRCRRAPGRGLDGRRVVGAVLVEQDEATGAALAVLDATNRIIAAPAASAVG